MEKCRWLFVLLGIFSISGCVTNPVDNLNQAQISQISTPQLCRFITGGLYKPSQKAKMEAIRRGLVDCSKSEVYCVSLGFNPRTLGYAECRMRYREQQIRMVRALGSMRQPYVPTQQTVVVNVPQQNNRSGIGLMQFQPETFQQANPYLTGQIAAQNAIANQIMINNALSN